MSSTLTFTNKDSISSNSNTILLTLPNVSLGENESEESYRNVSSNAEPGECKDRQASAVISLVKQFKGEYESVTAVDEEEDCFCHQHFTNKERLSPELQDVYKLLMQLPSFSHSSWSGFNNSAASHKGTAANMKKVSSLGKTRKNAFIMGKVGKFYKESASSTFGTLKETDTLSSTRSMKQDDMEQESEQPTREIVRMHSINLYQSILPSSLFARRNI